MRAHRQSRRAALTAGLVAVLVFFHSIASAQGLAAYASLVERYAGGDAPGAVTELARRSDQRLTKDIADWMAQLSPGQLRAAIMMHTDLAYLWLAEGQTSRGLSQIGNAERLVSIMIASSHGMPSARIFAIRWYAFSTSMYVSQGQLDAAGRFVNEGLTKFSDGAELYVSRGSIHEMRAIREEENDLRGAIREGGRVALRLSRLLENAAADFQRALDLDGALAAAHLHRGWVHHQLADARASADLEAALTHATDDRVRYMAHLFLGAVDERRRNLEAARREYEAARALGGHQTSYVALSRVEQALGHDDRARALTLEFAAIRIVVDDPWWDYRTGFNGGTLAWLRQEARHQ